MQEGWREGEMLMVLLTADERLRMFDGIGRRSDRAQESKDPAAVNFPLPFVVSITTIHARYMQRKWRLSILLLYTMGAGSERRAASEQDILSRRWGWGEGGLERHVFVVVCMYDSCGKIDKVFVCGVETDSRYHFRERHARW